MKPFESADFKKLSAEWDTKLRRAGFVDIEKTTKSGERVLVQSSANVFRQLEVVQRDSRQNYYDLISSAIHLHWFTNDKEEQLINRIATGEKLGAIAAELGIHRQTARYMLRRFENRYLIRSWTLEEMNLTSKEDSYSIIRFAGGELPETYYNMIMAQFLRSLKYGNEYFKLMDSEAYYKHYGKFVEQILARPNLVISLAVITSEKDTVLAWSLSEGSILHYVYCKKDYRRHGIASSILPKEVESVSHLTTIGAGIWNSKYPHAKFNPFI